MADEHLLKLLIESLSDPKGRSRWLERKLKMRLIDLASADLTERELRGFDFSEAVLSTSIFLGADASGADFSDAEMSYSDLRRAILRNCCFDRADLRNANLQGADLTDSNFEETILAGARLSEAYLVGADLSMADLRGADLRGASLKYTRLSGAQLEGADVADADLTGSLMDDDAPAMFKNFDLAVVDDRRYREMRSRRSRMSVATPTTEIAPVEGAPPLEEPEKPRRRRRKLRIKFLERGDGPEVIQADDSTGDGYVPTSADLDSVGGWYRVLGLERGSHLLAVTKAFRAKAKLYHPDKTGHLSEPERASMNEKFHLAREAYEKLSRRLAKPLIGVVWVPEVPRRDSPYDYSVAEYELLAKANPDHSDVLYNLAWKYFESGRMEEAIGIYEQVVRLDPDDEDAEFNLRVVRLSKMLDVPSEALIEGP